MKKYLVSVPIIARMEIYVDAKDKEEAKELAWLKASSQDTELINTETIEPIYFDDDTENIEKEMIEFSVKEGYRVWDYEKEFGK